MSKLSDEDFDRVHAALAKHPIGRLLVRDYEPVIDPDTELPSIHNAFVMSISQHDDRPGKLAHTRIDIRGEDGLIQTSFERDHVHYEPIDETSDGKELHVDVIRLVDAPRPEPDHVRAQSLAVEILDPKLEEWEIAQKRTELQSALGMGFAHKIEEVVLTKGTVLSPSKIELLKAAGIAKAATKRMTHDEIAGALLPLLDSHHSELPYNAMPVLEALSEMAKERVSKRSR